MNTQTQTQKTALITGAAEAWAAIPPRAWPATALTW
jgi:hypothetical protein